MGGQPVARIFNNSDSYAARSKMLRALCLFLLVGNFLFAQENPATSGSAAPVEPEYQLPEPSKSALSARVLLSDYGRVNGLDDTEIGHGIELAYTYHFNDWVSVVVPGKAGLARVPGFRERRTTVGADALLQLRYERPWSTVVPFVFGGVGRQHESNGGEIGIPDLNLTYFPFGAGINFRVDTYSFLSLRGEYRATGVEDHDNVQIGGGYHFNLAALQNDPKPAPVNDADGDGTPDQLDNCPNQPGPKATGGCPDSDGDGLTDDKDKCPDEAGSLALQGCPDRDGDSIPDYEDDCPDERGVRSKNGCPEIPDADGDGVPDMEDKCPVIAGLAKFAGCPDTDGDGVPNPEDDCPDEAGPRSQRGCPTPDRDGDGFPDGVDRCPDLAGTNNGCPPVDEPTRTKIRKAASNIQFETGKAILKTESFAVLESVVTVLEDNPDLRLRIEGHTDNVGSDESNLRLSQQRALASYDYLIARGIDPARLSYVGLGESQPIMSNDTVNGRAANRRTELKISY